MLTADPPAATTAAADDGAAQTEVERGVAYVKNEKFAEAEGAFQEGPRHQAHARGVDLPRRRPEKTGDRAGAEDAYKSALKLDGGFTEAAENLSALYLDEPARPDEAIAVLQGGPGEGQGQRQPAPEPRLRLWAQGRRRSRQQGL